MASVVVDDHDVSRKGRIEDGSFSTALPSSPSAGSEADAYADGSAADEFLDDIGYNSLVQDLADAGAEDEAFAQLQAKVDRCRELQRAVDEHKATLAQKQQHNAAVSERDAATQKLSDLKMEQIRKREEDAHRIESSAIPSLEKRAKDLGAEIDGVKAKIEEGPGWKEEQTQRRASLSTAIDQSRSEATAKSALLADARAQLKAKEKEVEASVSQRDQSLASIDALTGKLHEAEEQVLAAEQERNEAERSKGILVEALRVANCELADFKAERDRETQLTDHCAQEVAELQSKQQACSKDFNELAKSEEETTRELDKIRAANKEIQEGNADKQRDLDTLAKERDGLLKDRAKTSTILALIDKKATANEKERVILQGELDELNARAAKLENDVPLGRKEAEVFKREIRRAEQENDLVEGVYLPDKEILDLTKSNESTLSIQEMELSGIKRAVDELQKTRRSLAEEEGRDEQRLARVYEALQKKQQSLKSLEVANRALEAASAEAEERVRDQHKLCEAAREEHNLENKTLISLRESVHQAKTELVTLRTQMRSVTDDIARADDLVFKEHSHHCHVDAEREGLESDIANFRSRTAKLDERRAANDSVLDELGRQIDDEYTQRDLLRQKYRRILGEKDIIGANLIAADCEHRRINDVIEAHGTMNAIGDVRFGRLMSELDAAKAISTEMLKRKIAAKVSLEKQRERIEVLSSLQLDLSKQIDTNSALSAEIGQPVVLHRWRALRDKSPDDYAMLEKIHHLQRQASKLSGRIAIQTRNVDGKKAALSQMRRDAVGHQSAEEIQGHLAGLKTDFHRLSGELKTEEAKLQERLEVAEDIKQDVLFLEEKRSELKASYIVSVVNVR